MGVVSVSMTTNEESKEPRIIVHDGCKNRWHVPQPWWGQTIATYQRIARDVGERMEVGGRFNIGCRQRNDGLMMPSVWSHGCDRSSWSSLQF